MKISKSYNFFRLFLIFLVFTFLFISGTAFPEDMDCLRCHETLSKGNVVHQALSMGCSSCHSAIDATRLPHKTTNRKAKGLSSKQPDFCYDCHDKAQFMKKTVHDAMVLGCTSCHNPHASKDTKLLVSALPQLCFNCHDENLIMGKNSTHPQVEGVACTTCHNPHSTDTPQLLVTDEARPAHDMTVMVK